LVWVSDGKTLLATPGEGGDEPVLIARSVPKAAVIVCSDRARAGREAVEKVQPDLILLDDGFQRRHSLHRDLDILVLDASDPFSTGHVFPAGLLREPLGVLKEADVLVLNKWDSSRDVKALRSLLATLLRKVPLVPGGYRVEGFRDIRTGRKVPLSTLKRAPVGAFCGLGRPKSFLRTLAGLGIRPKRSFLFPDHFAYTEGDLRDILEAALAQGLRFLVTTAKDEVKLPKARRSPLPILSLDIRWEPLEGKARLEGILRRPLAR
jgi:tetraacyldisaccharide 4'-kinase